MRKWRLDVDPGVFAIHELPFAPIKFSKHRMLMVNCSVILGTPNVNLWPMNIMTSIYILVSVSLII